MVYYNRKTWCFKALRKPNNYFKIRQFPAHTFFEKVKIEKKDMQNFKNEIMNSSLVKVRESFLQKNYLSVYKIFIYYKVQNYN